MKDKKNYNQEIIDLVGDEAIEADIAELRAIKEEKVRRMDREAYRFYEPNGKCEEFIKAVGDGNNFITLFSAANGVGKTQAGANVVANFLFPGQNDWFGQKLFKNFPFPKRGRIVSDPGNIPNIVKSLEAWLPKGKYRANKGGKDYLRKWETDDGWHFDIMSYEQDPKDFEAETLGWVWFDEPPTQAIFLASVARLRMGGIIFITATMLKGSAWLYDKLVAGEMEVEGIDGEKIVRKVIYITAGVEDACIQHGVRGHLEHDNIAQMIAEYPEDEREARIYGRFQHLAGLIFKSFKKEVHIIPPFQLNLRDYVVVEALDPHPRTPDAVMWVAIDRKGQKFIVDELFMKCQNGSEELAQFIKEKAEKYRVITRIGDPSGWNNDQHKDDTRGICERLSDYGLDYIPATKNREAADKRIQDALAYVQIPNGEYIKAPELFVFETCRHTIWELQHYRWDEWAGKIADKKDAKEKPVDKDDHQIENLGRILLREPYFMELQASTYIGESDLDNNDPYE
jgi:phage terminase large subunit-like protein